jgi:hypothetical protein
MMPRIYPLFADTGMHNSIFRNLAAVGFAGLMIGGCGGGVSSGNVNMVDASLSLRPKGHCI